MRYVKPLALLGLLAIGMVLLGHLKFQRRFFEQSARISNYQYRSEFGTESNHELSGNRGGRDQREESLIPSTIPIAEATSVPPVWFVQGWTENNGARLIGVSLEGQTSVPSAIGNLTQLLREEILRELGHANVSDPEVLPQLSPDFIGKWLIPEGHLLLLPYEDDVTREASALQGQTRVPYYRGYAQAALNRNFFRLVRRWERYPELRDSLKWIGLGAGGVLASLALLFGYLKTDHLTHSHYTRRLQTLFASLLVAIAFLLYWLL